MTKECKLRNAELRTRGVRVSIFFILLIAVYCLMTSCSQPVLESEQCIASRDTVKKFYSFHIGNDMTPSPKYLERREKFLSKDLLNQLENQTDSAKDYFTDSTDYPKTFRASSCEQAAKDKTRFEIVLFWRTSETNIQHEIEVEAIKENDEWLINKVTPKE